MSFKKRTQRQFGTVNQSYLSKLSNYKSLNLKNDEMFLRFKFRGSLTDYITYIYCYIRVNYRDSILNNKNDSDRLYLKKIMSDHLS